MGNEFRRRVVTGDEEDAYDGRVRRIYCYLQRAGAVKKIKKATHRRERHEAEAELRRWSGD